jgi:hypothetical protein
MKTDYIVDKFAERVNRQNAGIQAFSEISWVDGISSRLPAKFPPSFVSLISRYKFDDFEAEDIWFYANRGDKTWEDLSGAIFRDEIMFRVTTSHGFIHFARPADGSYDPLCFNIRRRNNSGECPIVRLDHEAILQLEQIHVVDNISPSLLRFMEAYVNR